LQLIEVKSLPAIQEVAKALQCEYYFAHPYSSWERGLNEKNGLLRQFFPKGTRFEEVTERAVKRPRGYSTGGPERGWDMRHQRKYFFGDPFGENFAFQG